MNRICFSIFWVLAFSAPAVMAECPASAGISLQVLGSGGPEMGDGRASSGYLVWQGERAVVLVDVGSGTALNFEKSGARLSDLKAVLFTHFHVDHSVDFPSLVKASYFTGRDRDLPVYGPAGNELVPPASEFVSRLLGSEGAYRYLQGYLGSSGEESYRISVTDVPLAPRKIQHYQVDEQISVSAVPTHHGPLPAVAWRVDIGNCSISFSGDMSNGYNTLAALARGSDLLVAHNVIPEGATGTARSLHMPPSEIGKIAAAAGVGQLVLSHRMQRTLGREPQAEAVIREHFNGPIMFADDLDRVQAGRSGRTTSWESEKTFLSTRPELGQTWVVNLAGASSAERLFMRTLQGAVNRSSARLYLVNPDNLMFGEGEQFWIDEYARRGWVDVKGQLDIEQAIETFGPEIDGFVTASEAEPWSIHAAAVIAMLENGVVAPDAVADRLRQSGWRQLDDTRGRWPDAVSAYRAFVAEYRDELAYPGLALVRHTENLWDFVVQQQVMPVFSRPKHDTWDAVAAIMDSYPAGHILYGYVSDDTVEEEIAVERASSSGKYLVPTHEVSNLSFHVAVLGNAPLLPMEPGAEPSVAACDPSQVNVAIAITDGDNLQVPILQYPQSTFWNTEARGELPLGWSMGVSLSTLAPGIWEFYRSTARPNDEIVSLMGIAYVHASTLPEPEKYYRDTFSAMADAGVHTLWSLDSSLAITDEPLWQTLEQAPGRDILQGVINGYGPSIDKAFRRDTGTPVLITQNGYSEDAERIKSRIEAMLAMSPAERSPVNFLMATNWNATARDLYEALAPLADQGVRFLTPAQALACMPDIEGIARSAVHEAAPAGECLPSGPVSQFGSPILSAPALAQINQPITLPISLRTSAGNAVLTIDADSFAADFLHNRVLPVVEGYGLSAEFADDAWIKLVAADIVVEVPLPGDAADTRILGTNARGVAASSRVEEDSLLISLDSFTSDSRTQNPAAQVSVSYSSGSKFEGSADIVERIPESVSRDFRLTVGVGDEQGPLVGGVSGTIACSGTAREKP